VSAKRNGRRDWLAIDILNQEIYKLQTGLISALRRFFGTAFYTSPTLLQMVARLSDSPQQDIISL
jgi:uncharacterized membrane protein